MNKKIFATTLIIVLMLCTTLTSYATTDSLDSLAETGVSDEILPVEETSSEESSEENSEDATQEDITEMTDSNKEEVAESDDIEWALENLPVITSEELVLCIEISCVNTTHLI